MQMGNNSSVLRAYVELVLTLEIATFYDNNKTL